MATVSVRDLRYDFPNVEKLLQQGEEIQLTKRRKVIAWIVPEKAAIAPLPDFEAGIREIYGDKRFEVSGAELLSAERDRL